MTEYILVHNIDLEKIGYVSFGSDGHVCDFPACLMNLDKEFIGLIPEYYFVWRKHPITNEKILIYERCTDKHQEQPKKDCFRRLFSF